MSFGDDIKVSYYSAVLAKALKEEDGDLFTGYYDQIVALVTSQQADLAVDKARNFSNLPLPTIENKIKWLESHGVTPLVPPDTCTAVRLIKPAVPLNKEGELNKRDNSMSKDLAGDLCTIKNDVQEPDLVKLYNRTYQQLPADRVKEFIDDCGEEAVELTRPSCTKWSTGKKFKGQLDNNDNEKYADQNDFETIKQGAGKPCIIDMGDVDDGDEIDTKVMFFGNTKPKYVETSPCHTLGGLQTDIEMKDLSLSKYSHASQQHYRKGNIVTEMEPLQSPLDSDDYCPESSKKIKKKRKKKSKGADVVDNAVESFQFDNAPEEEKKFTAGTDIQVDEKTVKSSRSNRRKKLRDERGKSGSLECPPIRSSKEMQTVERRASNPQPVAEEKRKKRTIKSFKENRERVIKDRETADESKRLTSGSSNYGNYGSTSKKTDVKPNHSQLLDDATLNKILKELGEGSNISTDNKKKSKDSKKDKKKNYKKQKRCPEKEKLKDINAHCDEKSKMLSVGTYVPPVKDQLYVFGDEPPSSGEGEFITQKKSRRILNHPTESLSGHTSPNRLKRRFSDPAPQTHNEPTSVVGDEQNSAQNSSNQENFHAITRRPVISRGTGMYDRENESHWPTLTPAVSNCIQHSSAASRASNSSYASKLKSNLDSTGCSLASSSEDGASSSSSSSGGNNGLSSAAGRMSPTTDMDSHIPDALSVISSALALTTKSLKSRGRGSGRSENPLPSIQPVNEHLEPSKVIEVNHQSIEMKSGDSTVFVSKVEEAQLNIQTYKHNQEKNPNSVNLHPIKPLNNESLTLDCKSNNTQNTEKSNADQASCCDELSEKILPDEVTEIFENQWGLEFMIEDPSVQICNAFVCPDINDNTVFNPLWHESTPLPTEEQEVLTFLNNELTFVDESVKLQIKENVKNITTVPVEDNQEDNTSKTIPEVSTVAERKYNMRITDVANIKPWNNPGDFSLKTAASVLQQEWTCAFEKATYYSGGP